MVSDSTNVNNGNERGSRLKEQAQKIREELAALQALTNETNTRQSSVSQFATDKPPAIVPVRGTYNASNVAFAARNNFTTSSTDLVAVNRSELIVKADDIVTMSERIGQIFGSSSSSSLTDRKLKMKQTNKSEQDEEKELKSFLWIYDNKTAALQLDAILASEPIVTDCYKEFERQAPNKYNFAVKSILSYSIEKLQENDKYRYPTIALQSLFRVCAVEFLISFIDKADLNEIIKLLETDSLLLEKIEAKMNTIIEKKCEEVGVKSPRAEWFDLWRENRREKEKAREKIITSMTLPDDVVEVIEQARAQSASLPSTTQETKIERENPATREGFFDFEPPQSSSSGNIDRKRLLALSSLLDSKILDLPFFNQLSVLSFVSAYTDDTDNLAMLKLSPEDAQDLELVQTALKISLLAFFGEHKQNNNKENDRSWFKFRKNPFAVFSGLKEAADEERMAVRVNQAIRDLKRSLAINVTAAAAVTTSQVSSNEDRSSMIVSPSPPSPSSVNDNNNHHHHHLTTGAGGEGGAGTNFEQLLQEIKYIASNEMQSALDKNDKEEIQMWLSQIQTLASAALDRINSSSSSGGGNNGNKQKAAAAGAGAGSNREDMLRDWHKTIQAPEKKLFAGLGDKLDDLLSSSSSDNSKDASSYSNKAKLLDKLQNMKSTLRNNDANNKKDMKKDNESLRRELDRLSSMSNFRSAAEKFIVSHFDPLSRQEIGEISRKGASVLQSLLLTDIFRVTRIKYFNGAVIFGGELILRNQPQFVETIQQRLKETSLDKDFEMIVLDDTLDTSAESVSIEELALDEPFPTVVVFPKAWRSRAEVTLEEAQSKLFSAKKITTFFHSAIITSFCGMSAGVLDFAKNSNDANEILTILPSTEQLVNMALMIIATLGIQGVSNLVESVLARRRGVRLTHTSVPGLDFLTFGAKSTYLTLVQSYRDVFDMSAAHIGTSMTLSLAALSLGLKLMAGQTKEMIAAYPTLSVGFLQINGFIKAIVASQFPDIFLALEPQSLVHLHWLVIVGAMSFLGQVTQLLPVDNTAGDKMLSAVSKDSFSALLVRVAVGITKTLLLACAVFNVANINEGISRAKLLIAYTITGGVGRSDFEVSLFILLICSNTC